ncbi:MAG: hypothetical protein GXY85_09665 [Candidatus Brocadiaceae bacterium]|nr:hypothetical protein [Candidatus Brocadiaceae bacterium]
MASDDHYLTCLNQSMGHILETVKHGLTSLMDSVTVRDATLWNVHLISYGARHLSEERKAAHPEIDWDALGQLSGRLIGRDPWSVELNNVAAFVENDLPALRERLQRLLAARWSK